MKKSILCLALACLTLTTCGPDVKFKDPQPRWEANLKFIPTHYQGTFKSPSDSTFLFIDSFLIKKEWRAIENMRRDSLEKELKIPIKNDTSFKYYDKMLTEKSTDYLLLTIKLNNDSARIRIKGSEILFTLSDSQLVRSYKKYCFLNYRTNDNYWLVKTLYLKDKFLDFSDLISSKELENMGNFTKVITIKDPTSGKVSEYRLNPSRRELRKILRRKNIEESFVKQ